MTATMSMMLIDATAVSVALPTIQRELGASNSATQWVMNAYLLAVAALIAAGGRISDIYGHTRVFVVGVLLFCAASAAAAIAPSVDWLVAARAVQGMGAAAMVPAAVALVTATFPTSERGRAMGIYTGVSRGFLAIGPLIGGFLTDVWSWRGVFLINLPVGVAVLLIATLVLTDVRPSEPGRLDWVGMITLVAGLGGLVLALVQGPAWGWGSTALLATLGASIVFLVAFAENERRVARPLVELRLFRNRNFATELGVLAAVRFVLMGLTVLGAAWLQIVLGFSPIETGLSLLVMTIPMLIAAPLAGRWYDRVGARVPMAVGTGLIAFGFAWSAALLHVENFWLLVPTFLSIGIGMAPAMVPASSDSLNQAPPDLRAEAAGVSQAVRQVGAAVGLAVMGAVSLAVRGAKLDSGRGAAADDRERVLDAITSGVAVSFWIASALMLAALVAVLALVHGRERGRPSAHHHIP